MRKADREITDPEEKFAVLQRCEFLTLGIQDGPSPYQVPLHFGAERTGETLVLYCHCAGEGKKLDLIGKSATVSFSAARILRIFCKNRAPCGFTTDYESVFGTGTAAVAESAAERIRGLQHLMAHYTERPFSAGDFQPEAMARTTVLRIRVKNWTVKKLVRE